MDDFSSSRRVSVANMAFREFGRIRSVWIAALNFRISPKAFERLVGLRLNWNRFLEFLEIVEHSAKLSNGENFLQRLSDFDWVIFIFPSSKSILGN